MISKISIWILVMKMRQYSWGGIHWPVALSASNDSSFATLNALNTSYNIQYLMLHAIPDDTCNTWYYIQLDFQRLLICHTQRAQYQLKYSIPDVLCNTCNTYATSSSIFNDVFTNNNTSYNIQYLMLHAIPDALCNN